MGSNLTPVVKNLLIINVVLFALSNLFNHELMVDLLGLRYIFAPKFEVYQFITHMFMHANIGHLFSNMFALFIFGPLLEQLWGPKRFLIFYMVTGLGASALFLGVNFFETYNMGQAVSELISRTTPDNLAVFNRDYQIFKNSFINEFANDPDNLEVIRMVRQVVETRYTQIMNSPMIGASGAVYGILMAFGLLFPNLKLMLLIPPMPVKAKYLVAVYGVMALFGAIHNREGDNVAHYAHLGGMLFAWIMIMVWRKQGNNEYY